MIVISLGLFFVALTVSMFSLMTIENKNQEACFKRLDNSNFERYEYLKKRNIWFQNDTLIDQILQESNKLWSINEKLKTVLKNH